MYNCLSAVILRHTQWSSNEHATSSGQGLHGAAQARPKDKVCKVALAGALLCKAYDCLRLHFSVHIARFSLLMSTDVCFVS